MGGNGSFSVLSGGVPEEKRTHTDTEYRIDGHKVLVLTNNINHNKTPMNSNSENPIYLCGKVDKLTGKVQVSTIAVYEKHKLVKSIDLKFDKNGDLIPFTNNGDEKCSHSHNWPQSDVGEIGRKSHDPHNTFEIEPKYDSLIKKIVEFNKKGKKWNK